MKSSRAVLGTAALLVVGLTAAVALGSSSAIRTGSAPSGARTATTHPTTSETETETSAPRVWICHHTGSWKHPYHVIHISANALPAHRGHGDVDPGAGKSCPTAQPAGTTHGRGHGATEHGRADANEHAQGGKPDDEAESDDDGSASD